jgi:hypothetical protein
MLCDKHVVKMVLESAQMLCSIREDAPYKRAYYNHPCTIWSRASKKNYLWLYDHAKEIANEYYVRYNKIHKSEDVLDWCFRNIDSCVFTGEVLDIPLCMPDQYKVIGDPVTSYRNYYLGEKLKFAKWPVGKIPVWVK